MKNLLLITLSCVFSMFLLPVHAADAPVRMGCGLMTFDTVPGWGLGADGKSVLGGTHGGVAVDKAGNIYTSANKGVFVFSVDGKLIRSFVDKDHAAMHDIEIREEDGVEYIYGARKLIGIPIRAEGLKRPPRASLFMG